MHVQRLSLVLGLLLAACGGSGTAGSSDLGAVEVTFDIADPDAEGDAAAGETPSRKAREILLLHDTSVDVPLVAGESFAVRALVRNLETDLYVPGALVAWDIASVTDLDGAPAEGDGAPATEASYTSEDHGVAPVDFLAGTTPGRRYTLRASTDGADPVTMTFRVTAATCSCLDPIDVAYQGTFPAAALKKVEVHLLSADVTCGELFPEKALPTTLADKTLTGVATTTAFDPVCPADRFYTLYAVARNTDGCPVATACNDGVFLPADTCVPAKLDLLTLTQVVTGCYDVTHVFDFSGLVKECAGGVEDPFACVAAAGQDMGKQACCIVQALVTFFDTPGPLVVDAIVALAKNWIPDILVGAAEALFGEAVEKAINDWVQKGAPSWVQDFFAKGQELMSIITALELHSELCLSKVEGDNTVKGSQTFTGITLYWNGTPHTYSLADLQDTQFPLDIVGGGFDSKIASYDKLVIDPHKIKLGYGKLILFVLNELIISGVTNGQANTLQEAIELWIDCSAIADGILGDIAGWFNGDPDQLEPMCESAIDTLFAPVDLLLGSLQLDTWLSLSGSVTLKDDDCDLRTERLLDGHWAGQLQTSSASQGDFTGTFEGESQMQ